MLNEDGSQNGSGQDCGASRLCALSRDSTTAAAAIRCYRQASDRMSCERVLAGPTASEHVVDDGGGHGDIIHDGQMAAETELESVVRATTADGHDNRFVSNGRY